MRADSICQRRRGTSQGLPRCLLTPIHRHARSNSTATSCSDAGLFDQILVPGGCSECLRDQTGMCFVRRSSPIRWTFPGFEGLRWHFDGAQLAGGPPLWPRGMVDPTLTSRVAGDIAIDANQMNAYTPADVDGVVSRQAPGRWSSRRSSTMSSSPAARPATGPKPTSRATSQSARWVDLCA
jgi:hypothetical protein